MFDKFQQKIIFLLLILVIIYFVQGSQANEKFGGTTSQLFTFKTSSISTSNCSSGLYLGYDEINKKIIVSCSVLNPSFKFKLDGDKLMYNDKYIITDMENDPNNFKFKLINNGDDSGQLYYSDNKIYFKKSGTVSKKYLKISLDGCNNNTQICNTKCTFQGSVNNGSSITKQ